MQIDDELLVGITLAAAQLVVEMSEDQREGGARIAGGVQGAQQGDTVRTPRDGDDHACRGVRERTQALSSHTDEARADSHPLLQRSATIPAHRAGRRCYA